MRIEREREKKLPSRIEQHTERERGREEKEKNPYRQYAKKYLQ